MVNSRAGEETEPRAPQQHVADAARLLVARRERRLGEQVGKPLDDRLGELAALARGLPAPVPRRGRSAPASASRGSLGHSLDARQACRSRPAARAGSRGSGTGAWRPSRSTSRSTAIFAIRRHVVSLPPVIVISPLEVSYSSALREMSTDLRVSPVEISGRTPAYAPVRSLRPERRPEERVRRLEQIVDVLRGRADVIDVALVVVVGRAEQAATEPRQREDRPPLPRRDDRAGDERQVGRARS